MAIEKEGIYFMYELNYGMLCANFSEVLDYCFKNSDSFSMITTLKKPYKTNLPICVHDNIIECWKNCLINLKPDIKKWPGTCCLPRKTQKVGNHGISRNKAG